MKHLAEHELTAIVHDEIPAELEERILRHLAKCESCDRRLKPDIERYRALRSETALGLAPPPQPWLDMWVEMRRIDVITNSASLQSSGRKTRPVWTGLAAAAALAVAFMLWPQPDARLHAETLLPQIQASVSRSPSRVRQGLRVRTVNASFVRPMVLGTNRTDPSWREKFRAAHYDWDDPLNPRAFSEWRDSVKRRTDRVLISNASATTPKQYTIQTTAEDNVLQEASLTVDAASLLPIRASFVFAGQDWIEISVIADYRQEPQMAASLRKASPVREPDTALPQPQKTGANLASTELAVWLIADRLSDPTGEPIRMDVSDGNRIFVTPYSLNAAQLEQLRASLQGIEGIDLRIPDSLQGAPETLPDRDPIINASELILSRAHLLADLAARFPEATETRLTQADRAALWQLRSRHASRLNQEIQSLEARLKKAGLRTSVQRIIPEEGDSPVARLVQAAGRVNRLVTIGAASKTTNPDGGTPKLRLGDEIEHLKELAREYSDSVALSLESVQ
jgi:hypothetical protein